MTSLLTVITTDGNEYQFEADAKIDMNRDNLLLHIRDRSGTAGFHIDRFAALILPVQTKTGPAAGGSCAINVQLDGGREREMLLEDYIRHKIDENRLVIVFTGARQKVLVNTDRFVSYRIKTETTESDTGNTAVGNLP